MNMQKTVRAAIVASAWASWCLAPGPTAGAAVITWRSPANVAGDADVSTNGTLVNAVNIGETAVPTTTVNGVTFVGKTVGSPSFTSGNFTFATDSFEASNSFGTNLPPSLSPAYRALLGSAGGQFFGPPITLTIGDLTVGKAYEFQWWWSTSTLATPDTTASAGNSVTLDSGANGGLGQFAIGTFVADAPTQTIVFDRAAGENPQGATGLNGAQLRAVPEPGIGAAALAATCASLMTSRRARRAMGANRA